jgi:tRNA (guanine37-N1)-methyltransferase
MSEQVSDRIRVSNDDARKYMASATQDAWRNPMPPWTPPIPKKVSRQPEQHQLQASTSPGPPKRLVDHYIMNLPDSALTFLDTFRGIYKSLWDEEGFQSAVAASKMPLIHCYGFTKEGEADICQVSASTSNFVPSQSISVHLRHLGTLSMRTWRTTA